MSDFTSLMRNVQSALVTRIRDLPNQLRALPSYVVSCVADDVKGRRLLMPLAVLYCVLLVMSNILSGAKLVNLMGLTIAGGTIIFPASYVLNDAMSEVYGIKLFRRAMLMGIFSLFLASIFTCFVQMMPADNSWTHHKSYDAILGQFMRVNFASLCAIFAGSYINAWIVEKMKYRGDSSRERSLRFVASTAAAEALDTFLFLTIAFFGDWPTSVLLSAIVGQWFFKTMWEVIALPLTLPLVSKLYQYENGDESSLPIESVVISPEEV